MLWNKLRRAAIAGLAATAVSGGVGVYVAGAVDEGSPRSRPPEAVQGAPPGGGKETPGGRDDVAMKAQRLATRKARIAYEMARLSYELAVLAVEEYQEVVYPRDVAAVKGEVAIAESDQRRAEDRVDWAGRMFDKGYVSKAQKGSEELTFQKARFAVEQARAKFDVLSKYTKEKSIKELQGEVKKAESEMIKRKFAWEGELVREALMER